MKLRWSPESRRELADIAAHIALDNPAAAKRMHKRVIDAAQRLEGTPYMGRPGAILGTRELIPHPSYRIVYEIIGDLVRVTSVVHTARQWLPVADD